LVGMEQTRGPAPADAVWPDKCERQRTAGVVVQRGGLSMRAHIMTTSPDIGAMLEAALETEGSNHHVTVDAEVSRADRPIPLDVDLLIADLDHPCMSPAAMLRRLEQHPAAEHARVALLTSKCGTRRRLVRDHHWAVVVHSLQDLLRLSDAWLEILRC
jgi:CheY-like chemotaxis protein